VNVILFCARGCPAVIEADVQAATEERAIEGLRRHAAECGWIATEDVDICPDCLPKIPATYLAVLTTLVRREQAGAGPDYVVSGQRNDPDRNTYPYMTLTRMNDLGLVSFDYGPGERLAKLTEGGRAVGAWLLGGEEGATGRG
jgi:hypothetical protein